MTKGVARTQGETHPVMLHPFRDSLSYDIERLSYRDDCEQLSLALEPSNSNVPSDGTVAYSRRAARCSVTYVIFLGKPVGCTKPNHELPDRPSTPLTLILLIILRRRRWH
jgi:hypothetical protein